MLYNLLIVLHETVVSCDEVLNLHQSPGFGASYHACIELDGSIVYFVPSNEKAYAASNSKFININGEEESINNSVDDFAYHIALETPYDGREDDEVSHSGYTEAQYKSLVWLISKTGAADDRITLHNIISLSGSNDPRSFDLNKLYDYLRNVKRERVFDFGAIL